MDYGLWDKGCREKQGDKEMLQQINVEWKYVKSYASEKALMKRIEEDKYMYPEYDDRFIVVKTPEDRWTAIVILDKQKGGYMGRYEFLKV